MIDAVTIDAATINLTHRLRRSLTVACLLPLLWSVSSLASAQPTPGKCAPPKPANATGAALWLATTGNACAVRPDACVGPVCALIADYEKAPTRSIDDAPVKVFEAIEKQATDLASSATTQAALVKKHVDGLLVRLRGAKADLRLIEPETLIDGRLANPRSGPISPAATGSRLTANTWQPDELVFFRGEPSQIDLDEYFKTCDTSCDSELAAANEVVRLVGLVRRTLTHLAKPWSESLKAHVDAVVGQWDQFIEINKGQMPWELLLNGRFYGKHRDFRSPPTSQMILIHPEPAGWFRTSEDRRLTPTVAVSLIGFRRWRWPDLSKPDAIGDDSAKASSQWGVGLLTVLGAEGFPKAAWGANVYASRGIWVGYATGKVSDQRQHFIVVSGDVMRVLGNAERVVKTFRGAATQ
jgi:hypothetical protein